MTGASPSVLERGQEREAADALVASHADYPAFRHVFRDTDRRLRALRPFFTATIRDAIPFRHALAVRDAGRTVGTAVWLPPGAFPWSGRRKARATPEFLGVLAADPTAFRTFMRYGANAEHAHPTESHWYLVVLGVRPDAQRRGFGTELVTPVLDRADAVRLPCLLETSDRANVAYYERFGFAVVDDALALVPDGPTHVAMRRAPR